MSLPPTAVKVMGRKGLVGEVPGKSVTQPASPTAARHVSGPY